MDDLLKEKQLVSSWLAVFLFYLSFFNSSSLLIREKQHFFFTNEKKLINKSLFSSSIYFNEIIRTRNWKINYTQQTIKEEEKKRKKSNSISIENKRQRSKRKRKRIWKPEKKKIGLFSFFWPAQQAVVSERGETEATSAYKNAKKWLQV